MVEVAKPSRIVGILGGMGPAATADFYTKLIQITPAQVDQDHLRVVIWADPTVPDRHDALIEGGPDPTPWLQRGLSELVRSGAEIIVAPCNTVHAYLPRVLRNEAVDFISIIDTAVEAVCVVDPGGTVGILATDGALASDLYQSALRAADKKPVTPTAAAQAVLMQSIYNIKAGCPPMQETELVNTVVDGMRAEGVRSLIVGCTELSLLFAQLEIDIPVVDASIALALKTVERAREPRLVVDEPAGVNHRHL